MASSATTYVIQTVKLKEYEPGNLWIVCGRTSEGISVQLIMSIMTKDDAAKPAISLSLSSVEFERYFEEISQVFFMLLIAIKDPKLRLDAYTNQREFLNWACMLKVGKQVKVQVVCDNGREFVDGVIRYIGEVSSTESGHMFGIELSPEHEGKGASNGTFKNKVYFQCKEDCGVFVNVLKLEPATETPTCHFSVDGDKKSLLNPPPPSSTSCPLAINDRIVWMSDEGPEHGTVRWIGYLPDALPPRDPSHLTVGVEFDNPVGTGTGRYKSQTLFQTERQHASLIPILGLVKESDFLGFKFFDDQQQVQKSSHCTSNLMTDSQTDEHYKGTSKLPDVITSGHPSSHSQIMMGCGSSSVNSPPLPAVESLHIEPIVFSNIQKGKVMPPSIADVDSVCGPSRGIQCYSPKCSLEVAIFTCFAFYSDFDEKLFAAYSEDLVGGVRRMLVEHIVNPMRATSYVSSDKLKKFGELFCMLQSAELSGCATGDVKLAEEPAEAVVTIFKNLLQLDAPLELANAIKFVYSVDMPPTPYPFPRVQHLLEHAILHNPGWRLASIPRSVFVLSVNAKRFGQIVRDGRIFPTATLDLSGILTDSTNPCCMCGSEPGLLQCGHCFASECYSRMTDLPDLSSFCFCKSCYDKSHQRIERQKHEPFELTFSFSEQNSPPTTLNLFAIISLVNDHFVSFFKAGHGESSAWLMYEPKARRVAQSGSSGDVYLPEIKRCDEIAKYLSDVNSAQHAPTLPDIIAKMISGLHLCFYRASK